MQTYKLGFIPSYIHTYIHTYINTYTKYIRTTTTTNPKKESNTHDADDE